MPNAYLVEIHQHICGQMEAAAGNAELRCLAAGRLKALADLESFLHRNFDHKLPRRIYRRLRIGGTTPGGHPRPEAVAVDCRSEKSSSGRATAEAAPSPFAKAPAAGKASE